jgi:hypothetical protein
MALTLFWRLRVSRQFRILVEDHRNPAHYTAWEWVCWRFFVATADGEFRRIGYASAAGLLGGAGLALLFWALGGR